VCSILHWKILIPTLAYLIGNLNFGIIVSRLFFKKDIRLFGSGNPGATNAFRVLGKAAGVFVLLADSLKGAAAVLLARRFLGDADGGLWPAMAGLCVMLGHIFPAAFKFRGGKGVATTAGAMAALQPPVFFALLACPFAALLFLSGYMSVASIACALALPPATLLWHRLQTGAWELTPLFWVTVAQAATVVFAHRSNIKRLRSGTESKLLRKKKEAP
jgi:glycerol-3-phosphate acyltransferase PlsY